MNWREHKAAFCSLTHKKIQLFFSLTFPSYLQISPYSWREGLKGANWTWGWWPGLKKRKKKKRFAQEGPCGLFSCLCRYKLCLFNAGEIVTRKPANQNSYRFQRNIFSIGFPTYTSTFYTPQLCTALRLWEQEVHFWEFQSTVYTHLHFQLCH